VRTILKDAAKDTVPDTKDVEEGNSQADTQAEHIKANDNHEGDEV
jgi:hypothetical protein